jgi:hypothetical protein
MLGIIPNWETRKKDDKGVEKVVVKNTKEKQIFDHLVKNIGNTGFGNTSS